MPLRTRSERNRKLNQCVRRTPRGKPRAFMLFSFLQRVVAGGTTEGRARRVGTPPRGPGRPHCGAVIARGCGVGGEASPLLAPSIPRAPLGRGTTPRRFACRRYAAFETDPREHRPTSANRVRQGARLRPIPDRLQALVLQ